MDSFEQVICTNCNFAIRSYEADKAALPCPNCASIEKTIILNIEDGIETFDLLETKEKGEGKKPVREIKEGFEYFHKEKRFVLKERVIDREADNYFEKIQDPKTGELIHFTNHSLTKHTGHGSAKFSNKPKT
jgi:hypothetical protein